MVVVRLVDGEEEVRLVEFTGEAGAAGRMGLEEPGLSHGLGGEVRLMVPATSSRDHKKYCMYTGNP